MSIDFICLNRQLCFEKSFYEKEKAKAKAFRKDLASLYVEQKGKSKRRWLKDFIEQRADEIVAYSENLTTTAMKKAEKGITVPGNVAVAAIQPSPALIEELHNAQNNYLQLQDAGNN